MPNKSKIQSKKSKEESGNARSLVISYLTLRTYIGILGIAFPFVVSIGAIVFFHTGQQDSISAYYHTGMRDVFVGVLWAIGFFLLSYQGYEQSDDVAGNLACLFAVGVSLFPETPKGSTVPNEIAIGHFHFFFATMFFLTLIYFSLFLFTKTSSKKKPTERKLLRNKVYQTCGYVMAACILLIAADFYVPFVTSLFMPYQPVYWFESLAILAFGISWFTKGEAILKDE